MLQPTRERRETRVQKTTISTQAVGEVNVIAKTQKGDSAPTAPLPEATACSWLCLALQCELKLKNDNKIQIQNNGIK